MEKLGENGEKEACIYIIHCIFLLQNRFLNFERDMRNEK